MKGASYQCPVPGCSILKRHSDLMCLSHWRHVPKLLQRHVYDTWRKFQQEKNSADADPFDLLIKYREARDEAIRVAGLPSRGAA